jgi:hypothetical protein
MADKEGVMLYYVLKSCGTLFVMKDDYRPNLSDGKQDPTKKKEEFTKNMKKENTSLLEK